MSFEGIFYLMSHWYLFCFVFMNIKLYRFGKAQSRAIKKLQAVVKSLEGQINSKDAALLSAVENLVSTLQLNHVRYNFTHLQNVFLLI